VQLRCERRRRTCAQVIRALAKHDRIADRIFKSIAPSIYGHHNIKVCTCVVRHTSQRRAGCVGAVDVWRAGKGRAQQGAYVCVCYVVPLLSLCLHIPT
jgi:hypothetical protein